MGVLTLAEVIQLLAALIGASPKIIQIIQEMHAKGATNETKLTPEQTARVAEAIKPLNITTSENPVIAAILRV